MGVARPSGAAAEISVVPLGNRAPFGREVVGRKRLQSLGCPLALDAELSGDRLLGMGHPARAQDDVADAPFQDDTVPRAHATVVPLREGINSEKQRGQEEEAAGSKSEDGRGGKSRPRASQSRGHSLCGDGRLWED